MLETEGIFPTLLLFTMQICHPRTRETKRDEEQAAPVQLCNLLVIRDTTIAVQEFFRTLSTVLLLEQKNFLH
jgi:hypothetical protein